MSVGYIINERKEMRFFFFLDGQILKSCVLI